MDPSVQQFLFERFNSNAGNGAENNVHHRQLLVISGAEVWCLNQIEQLLNGVISCHSQSAVPEKPEVLTCNADLPKGVHYPSTNNVQFRQHLGREYDIVIYNAWRGIRANALAALSGTIKHNGLLILLCPELSGWHQYKDEELVKRISWGYLAQASPSLFVAHLVNAIHCDNDVFILSESGFTGRNHIVNQSSLASTQHKQQQREVIALIKKVATGHRKRPLVLTADRGRGKSAALGIALAELVVESPGKFLVTAPQKSSVETLFRHALQRAPNISDHIQFCAVDDLVLNLPEADILVVDEAAAIPVAQLKTLCNHYHRMVFSTTTNGYEGSGRGFEVRFKPWLNKNRPQAKFASLSMPFRWYLDDCLEAFWWKTLHLKPTQSESILSGSNLINSEQENDNPQKLIFREVSKADLLADQTLLNSVFSLLVDAHYQTTPDDFVALLDAPDQRLFILFLDQVNPANIVAMLNGSIEGQITDDDKLALNIASGQRRLQGHMLPQQLTYGTGERDLLQYQYFRVIRIATRSALRSKGYGSILLQHIDDWCAQNRIDLLGSSFGATPELLSFWHKAGFTPALLGFHRDKATAEFNITVIKPLTKSLALEKHLSLLQCNLEALLTFHLPAIWKNLDNYIVTKLLSCRQISGDKTSDVLPNSETNFNAEANLNTDDNLNTDAPNDAFLLNLFCKGNRSLELSATVLTRLVWRKLQEIDAANYEYQLLIDYCLKRLPNTELVKLHKLEGKKQLLLELKRLTLQLMEA